MKILTVGCRVSSVTAHGTRSLINDQSAIVSLSFAKCGSYEAINAFRTRGKTWKTKRLAFEFDESTTESRLEDKLSMVFGERIVRFAKKTIGGVLPVIKVGANLKSRLLYCLLKPAPAEIIPAEFFQGVGMLPSLHLRLQATHFLTANITHTTHFNPLISLRCQSHPSLELICEIECSCKNLQFWSCMFFIAKFIAAAGNCTWSTPRFCAHFAHENLF